MKRSTCVLSLTLAAHGLLLWGAANAADPIPCERRLPRDAAMYFSCRNVAEFRAQWNQTALTKLVEMEALSEAKGALAEQFAEASRGIEQQWGMSLVDLLNVPQGELAAALSMRPNAAPQGVIMLDFGDKRDEINKVLEKLAEAATGAGATRSEEEFEDTHVVLFQPVPREDDGNGRPQLPREAYGYFVRDTFLVLGTSPDALKGVLARWDGASNEVFAEGAVYRYAIDRCRDPHADVKPLVSWFVDPMAAFRAGLAAQQGGPAGMLQMLLPGLGIEGLRGVAGTYDLARGDFDMISRTLVYLEPPLRGVLSLFQFETVPHNPPRWVTAESAGYLAFNWNLSKVYTGVVGLVDTFLGPGGAERHLAQYAEQAGLAGLQLKKDVLDPLSGKIHMVTESAEFDGQLTETYLVAAELKDVAAARATLRKLTQSPLLAVKERQFQGESIYEIESDDDDDGPGPAMGLAIAENHLMFASDVKLLEKVLRGADGRDPLSDSSAYRRVAGRFPEVTSYVSYNREDDDVKQLLAILKSGALTGLLGPNGEALVSRLPSYETLKKHLPSAGGYMEPDERGLKFTGFSLKVEE
ncbi:MAG: DUF3352 domain-containing protein [Planctomycetaceae bacterium]